MSLADDIEDSIFSEGYKGGNMGINNEKILRNALESIMAALDSKDHSLKNIYNSIAMAHKLAANALWIVERNNKTKK